MAKIFILWTQDRSAYRATEPVLLRAYGDGTEAQSAMDLIAKCEPRHSVMISEVEFIGAATPALQLPQADPYRRHGFNIPPLAGLPQHGALIGDPPPSPGESLSDLAEKIHEMSEA